ncbi:secretin N-terminal domain-containing protein [Photobacterium piscicola]|uniref:secretin N-terminal domain-containing protein n=1 Tax=Photobacterium piscicola TaxID=1378299 RepID=UPI002E17FC83|nr:secretin N-terminal domain-containing protein [Photobacterium piscicola]
MKAIIVILLLSFSFNTYAAKKIDAFEAQNMPIAEFVQWFSTSLNKNVIVSEGVKGAVTFSAPSLDAADFYPFIETVLASNGFRLEKNGNIFKVSLLRVGDPLPQVLGQELLMPGQTEVIVRNINVVPPKTKFYDLLHIDNKSVSPIIQTLLDNYSTNTGETQTAYSIIMLPHANSLIVTGSPSQIVQIDNLIQRIDVRRKQIFIQAVVVESQINDGQEVGVNLNAMLGDFGFSVITKQTEGVLTGGSIIFKGGDIDGLINAISTNSKTKLLSKPHLLITDREQGYITVGQNVPFLVSSEVTDGGNTIQKIERQNVGVSLRVTPHIIGDTVLMNINQTSSSVSNSDITSDIITNNRQIQTVIQAKDGQSIILGGLVGEESRNNDTGVPILKDIPLIGSLFGSTSDREINNQLSVLIKVSII